MVHKISFYGYFFCKEADHILRYEILWKNHKKFLLKNTTLDFNHKNPTEEIVVMVYDNLRSCIAGIVGRLRNLELENGLYQSLQPTPSLAATYESLVCELENAIRQHYIKSFSFFGNPAKYSSQADVSRLLKPMGYFVVKTNRPHIYVLHDFLTQEHMHKAT